MIVEAIVAQQDSYQANKRALSFSPPDISEREMDAVVKVLQSGWITTGPMTKSLEKKIAEYTKSSGAVCLSSATAALEMTLRLLGIGPGDEVITTAYTFTASASVIAHVGARIILCDTMPGGFEMDYDQLGELVTDKTKAVIAVDFAGILCDYNRIYEVIEGKKALFTAMNSIQEDYGRIVVISDSAHALGAVRAGKHSGEIADFTAFSFHAVKNLTTAEGGAICWKNPGHVSDEWIYRQYMLLSLHGQSKDALAKTRLGTWEYDILTTGYKCNMTDIAAAIGLIQLDRYNDLLKRRFELIGLYDSALGPYDDFILPVHESDGFRSSGHLYPVRLRIGSERFRNEVIEKLAACGVPTNVHFKPLPMLTAYKELGFDIADYPNAYSVYCNEITLPLHTRLTDDDIEFICRSLIQVVRSVKEDGI